MLTHNPKQTKMHWANVLKWICKLNMFNGKISVRSHFKPSFPLV